MTKSAKRRFCPLMQRDLSPAECGDNRVSRYACPADCIFNPYGPANYEAALALDDSLNSKATLYLLEAGPDRAATERELVRLRRHASPHALHAWVTWRQFFARDHGGRTLAERWEQEGFPGLKNDERVLMKARMRTKVALVEVRRVIDREQVEVVDLLEEAHAPFCIRDRSFAAQAVRFSVFLAWMHRMPHYSRLAGAAINIPDVAQLEPQEVVREIVRHLGGPVDETGIRLWLAEQFVRFDQALAATMLARHANMFAAIDATWGRVVYDLRRPFAECRSLLDDQPAVHLDDLREAETHEGFSEARVWFDEDVEGPAAAGRAVLGRVLLGKTHWQLEAMGAARTAQLRRRFESLMGTAVRFASQRLDDPAASLKQDEPTYDRSLVPPRLLEDPERVVMRSSRVPKGLAAPDHEADFQAALLEAEDRRFLDSRIPALDDKTPREAARDPQLRPKLIRLMKQRVRAHDQRNLKAGRRDDINWLLRELELKELLFDPPPPRPPRS
ncbi:MAG TPA: hypothetical protein PKM73_04610 [Verrucomicrobiota bacterium]|nr:hypothetical protein [Verrucomicrobiota bacterium]HNU50619.1 hypothetical protein [Verrucomicrobiota bacterium]